MIGILCRFLSGEMLLPIVPFFHTQDEKCEFCFPQDLSPCQIVFHQFLYSPPQREPSSADCVKSTFDATDVTIIMIVTIDANCSIGSHLC